MSCSCPAMIKTGMAGTIGGNMIVERIQVARKCLPLNRTRANAYAAGSPTRMVSAVEHIATIALCQSSGRKAWEEEAADPKTAGLSSRVGKTPHFGGFA